MAIETICSGCGQRLAVSDENAGKRARCPACGQIFSIPVPQSATDADSAAPADPALAETIASPDSSANSTSEGELPSTQVEQYWMRTETGTMYGPVDRANLNRWFNEGRVGPGYQIRVGEYGSWQAAGIFQPNQGSSVAGKSEYAAADYATANPYADGAYRPVPQASLGRYQKGDPSGLVLTMGILSWVMFLICPFIHWVPGLIAWVSGGSALRDIQAGVADPTNRGLVQVGYYLGMANVILTLLGVAGFAVVAALGVLANNF